MAATALAFPFLVLSSLTGPRVERSLGHELAILNAGGQVLCAVRNAREWDARTRK